MATERNDKYYDEIELLTKKFAPQTHTKTQLHTKNCSQGTNHATPDAIISSTEIRKLNTLRKYETNSSATIIRPNYYY